MAEVINLKERREAAGMTQAQLAVKAGLSVTAIANWEQGKSTPSEASRQKIENALNGTAVVGFQPQEIRSVREFEGTITSDMFRKMFKLPDNAVIVLVGGDGKEHEVSSTLGFDNQFYFNVRWTEEK